MQVFVRANDKTTQQKNGKTRGRRRRLVHFQFSPTPNFPVYGGFWLREKLIAVADAL
ncbi:hypothetical protein HanXRQr2_Chr07g0284771 [Helianthus annuus]|uniref:Uncharacterized protein n=1 Tax=Helianthus annuus TaxID=4232 RepID=A0A9K3NFC7_HELAN|nr:hypothetical protein HanXRQr2_Chr07g0284771 [Helianthus annuus]KAJ0555842.1 hypothetical protein HanIR_Chr07g0306821 [Helianthus annuus]KAJ0731213.1 hypothetical protein HanOQP8_Chr07g0249391 [Helianthus annuus]KAJ0903921.1 hypothetical protein HanPSC8_Chr07g0275681 [Helianthus annuus]